MRSGRLNRRTFMAASAAAAGGVATSGALGGSGAYAAGALPGGECDYSKPYAQWSKGPNPTGRSDYFPLCVWLQSPQNAPRYKEIGINCFVGLYEGPTEDQLATLGTYGMRTICAQNAIGLKHVNDPIIMGWLQPDEPDNAQPLPSGGYGPPTPAADIIQAYQSMVGADPSRPVYLGMGQGVADDTWVGRGVALPWDDYYDYVRGGDINAFDIYPIASGDGPDWLWYPSKGVDRLHMWGDRYGKVVWNVIETTNVSSSDYPTPDQVRSEVWMSIIHGSRGITYFCHKFAPTFDETGLLDEPEMKAAVAALNAQIAGLASVLNSPPQTCEVDVQTSDSISQVDVTVREQNGATYLFAACMRNAGTTATFTLPNSLTPRGASGTVLDENRSVGISGGSFKDDFDPYAIHLYKITRGGG